MIIYAHLDYETPPCSRANGMFQVVELTDENGNDRTKLVDVGQIFQNLQQLKTQIGCEQLYLIE